MHGGGWQRGDKRNATGAQKVEHWTQAGYAFASINYRLVPAATVKVWLETTLAPRPTLNLGVPAVRVSRPTLDRVIARPRRAPTPPGARCAQRRQAAPPAGWGSFDGGAAVMGCSRWW